MLKLVRWASSVIVQELCESRGGRPGRTVLRRLWMLYLIIAISGVCGLMFIKPKQSSFQEERFEKCLQLSTRDKVWR